MTPKKPSSRPYATELEATHLQGRSHVGDQFEQPVAIQSWARPFVVKLVDDQLCWLAWGGEKSLIDQPEEQWQELEQGLLRDFLRLAEAEPPQILRFAERWGVLELCRHDLPCSHTVKSGVTRLALEALAPVDSKVPTVRHTGECEMKMQADWVLEPLSAWRRVASSFSAIVRITAAERLGRTSSKDDWEVLGGDRILIPDRTLGRSAPMGSGARTGRWRHLDLLALGGAEEVRATIVSGYVTNFIEGWMDVADTRLQYRWGPGGAEVFIGTQGLFGALVVDLALAVGGSHGFAFCSSCSLPYVPRRQPSRGRRNYCIPCRRENIPLRDAKRDQRRRERVAKPGEIV